MIHVLLLLESDDCAGLGEKNRGRIVEPNRFVWESGTYTEKSFWAVILKIIN